MKTQTQTIPGRKSPMPDWLFVLWAGGTALLSYSLVYALRKPFTAAEFEGLQVYGMDYKIAVSIIQLLGYVSAKLLGIKYISELRPEGVHHRFGCPIRTLAHRLRFAPYTL